MKHKNVKTDKTRIIRIVAIRPIIYGYNSAYIIFMTGCIIFDLTRSCVSVLLISSAIILSTRFVTILTIVAFPFDNDADASHDPVIFS